MAEYVDPAVEEIRNSNAATAVTLLIGASDDRDALEEQLLAFDVTIEGTVGQTALRVRTTEAVVDDLCHIGAVSSIEFDYNDVEVLDEGNSQSRQRVI